MARGRLFCLIASLASSVAIVDVNGLGSTADTPHVGRTFTKSANGSRANVFVIGTSHFRCGSAVEVASLIAEVRPDGLLLELDPERTVRLTKQFHRFNADGERPESNVNGDLLYGADFVSAINTCQDLDIPLFLGDEYAQETFSRLREKSLDWKSYSPVPLLRSFMTNMSRGVSSSDFIDIVQTFRSDPQKATPLLVTTSPSVVLASGLLALSAHSGASAHDGVSSLADMGETLLSVTFSALLSSLLFNTIIRDRDEVLAQSALNSIDVLSSLKQGQSVRKRWRFSVNDERGDGDKTDSSQIPIFTLKRPLLKGIERNLNLFEPRWLKMIDSLSSEAEARFGCVQCVNKFYSTIAVGDKEGRYADIIFKRKGRIARIKRIEEGKRPSGDRRIGVTIEGCESFVVDNENISVVEDGYMVSHANSLSEKSPKPSETDRVTLVVVVGLLHGNGILDILNKS